MSVKFPQIDYPRGSLPRGGSDIWDTPQASVVLADDMFASAGPAPTVLTGNNVASTATSTQGAISQTHALTGAASSQANTSTTGAVTQTHILTGSDCQQANASTTGAVIHTHALAGDNCTQANTCTDGAVTVGSGVIVLTGADCDQANTSAAGAVLQAHILVGNGVAVDHIAAASAIVQTHILAGANCASFNEVGLALGIVTHPSVQFMQDTYDAQCFGREYGIGISSDNFDANMESVVLSTVFQTDQRAIAMEN